MSLNKQKQKNSTMVYRPMSILSITITLLLSLFGGCKKESTPTEPGSTAPTDSIPQKAGWNLVWNDEFTGTTLDLTKWEYEVNGDGGGNNELQYYTNRQTNCSVDSGNVVIHAQKESYLSKQYTSARIRTRMKGDWKYGYVEVRAILPYGRGMWPAIWMLPTDWEYGGWPMSGEIDIMELLGDNPWKVYGTIHYGASVSTHQSSGSSYTLPTGSASFAGGYHVFAVEWDSTGMQWYVDGRKFYTVSKGSPFDKRFHLLLNVAVGGNWPGSPDEFTTFPQTMIVDYVRVYQKK